MPEIKISVFLTHDAPPKFAMRALTGVRLLRAGSTPSLFAAHISPATVGTLCSFVKILVLMKNIL